MSVVFKSGLIAMSPLSHFADMTKDAFLVIQVGFFAQNATIFIKWVYYSLFGILVFPYVLSLSRIIRDWYKLPRGLKKMLALVCIPISPILLIFLEEIMQLRLECCNDQDKVKQYQELYSQVKIQTTKLIKTELGLEMTIQIALTILLIMLARSETRTVQGLEKIFDNNNNKDLPFGVPTILVVLISILWSYKSAWTSFVKGISLKKDFFPIKAKLFVGIYVLLSLGIKVTVHILFLTPALGLGNLLRHYQGELMPYRWIVDPLDQANEPFPSINVETDLMYYSNAPPIAWSLISRWNYTDLKRPQRPPLTLYTIFPLKVYLVIFWLLIFLQPVFVYFTKKYSNPGPFGRQSWLDRCIHAMENSQIPSPMEDFEELPGSLIDHLERSKKVIKEIGLTILVNTIQHLVMLIPIFILCKYKFYL